MLKPLFLNSEEGRARLSALTQRKFELPDELEARVKGILSDVRNRGDQALVEYTRRFDAPEFEADALRVTGDEIEQAYELVDRDFLNSLRKAIGHIREFHSMQAPKSWFTTRENGVILGQKVSPVDAAGLYVPGGQAGQTPLVSSVLMNGIPAGIAGVKRLVLATPPGPDGKISPYLLAAAAEIQVREIYKMGSAWAIAALAYGTESVPPVDVIVGPGNIYVTMAKKLVSGLVGIDMVAGPSEILILSDASQNPAFIAADLLSQAEHDPMATSVLVTDSPELADKVCGELERQLGRLARSEIAEKSLEQNGLILVVEDMDEAAKVANQMGPEHLEVLTRDPWSMVPRLRHAGALFLGSYTPEPIGDYIAGPNHVLPTMGTARFSSALGVETFIKRTSIISYSGKAFSADAEDVIRLANIEGLGAHAGSVEARIKKG